MTQEGVISNPGGMPYDEQVTGKMISINFTGDVELCKYLDRGRGEAGSL